MPGVSTQTRSGLVAARIYEVQETAPDSGEFEEKSGGTSVSCMFNPYEYAVTKSNSFGRSGESRSDPGEVVFQSAGPQTLTLNNLIFDTYEDGTDVSLETDKLWKFMEPVLPEGASADDKPEPPHVAFEWGVFRFIAVVSSMTQTFTLFKSDGTPVRAKVNMTFQQHVDLNDYPNQNPSSGGGPAERVRRVLAGERLDTIAADVYGDATKWRLIAQYNSIVNPLAVRPGLLLRIPID